jgi:hypothetical protein
MRVLVRRVRGRKNAPNWAEINREVERTMRQKIAPKLLGYHKRITNEWSGEKPNWEAKTEDAGDHISTKVQAPPSHGADKWVWLRGTEPHTIKPKSAGGTLAFPTGYQPRTRPGAGGQYKGPGKATGETVFAKEVKHPGTKPRKLEEAIVRWIKPYFYKEIENAMRRGVRKANT